jgi:histidyl-tRNA synthetase
MINHRGILEAILDHCKVSDESRYSVLKCLEADRVHSNVHLSSLTKGSDRSVALLLSALDIKAEVHIVKDRLKETFKIGDHIWKAFDQVERLVRNLSDLGVKRVLIMPLLSYHHEYYGGSFMFQIGKIGSQKIDVFVAGGMLSLVLRHLGRYDALLERLGKGEGKLRGVGFNLAIEKIVHVSMQDVKSPTTEPLYRRITVLVAAIGKSTDILSRMKIASDLWAAGISADYLNDERDLVAQDIVREATEERAILLILIKTKGPRIEMKLRNMMNKTEQTGKFLLVSNV